MKSTIAFLASVHGISQFLAPAKNSLFLQFIHNNDNNNNNNHFHHQLLQTVFSECTEAVAISLVPLETILPEKADGVLADAILILPHPPILPTNIRKIRGPRKKFGK